MRENEARVRDSAKRKQCERGSERKEKWERKREGERQGGSMIDNGADRTPLAMLSVAVWGDRASPRETELPLATVPAHTPHLVGSPTLGQGSWHHGATFGLTSPECSEKNTRPVGSTQ